MKTLTIIFVISAICAAVLHGQMITGNSVLKNNMQIKSVDNCTAFLCGDQGITTGSDKNFKAWFASRIDGVAGRACRVAAILSKTGAPIGTFSIALFSDNAGQPGTKLYESGTLDAAQIASGQTNNFPGINWTVPAQTLWVAIHCSDPVLIGAATDYVSYHNKYTGTATDPIYISDDGATWVDGGARAFLCIRLLYAQ